MTIFLETERLIIKNLELSDLENLITLRSDPKVMQYVGNGLIQSRQEVEVFLKFALQYQEKYGFSFNCVFEKDTGAFVGQAGLFHKGFQEEQDDIEIAYRLQQKFWGKGYATELVNALIVWGFEHLSVKKLVAFVYPGNTRSQHVLEKAKMQCIGLVNYKDKTVWGYEIYPIK